VSTVTLAVLSQVMQQVLLCMGQIYLGVGRRMGHGGVQVKVQCEITDNIAHAGTRHFDAAELGGKNIFQAGLHAGVH